MVLRINADQDGTWYLLFEYESGLFQIALKMEVRKLRTTRLREKIKKFLNERGQANTTEILEHVNSTMRHGTTPQQLGNVLSKDKDIRKIATTKRGGALSGRYEICVWTLRDDDSGHGFKA